MQRQKETLQRYIRHGWWGISHPPWVRPCSNFVSLCDVRMVVHVEIRLNSVDT